MDKREEIRAEQLAGLRFLAWRHFAIVITEEECGALLKLLSIQSWGAKDVPRLIRQLRTLH